MTDKLTTAEVRLAATTNEDLTLTQHKKLVNGFDAWIEEVKAEGVAEFKRIILEAQKAAAKPVQGPVSVNTPSGDAPVRPVKRKRVRPKKNKSVTVEKSTP